MTTKRIARQRLWATGIVLLSGVAVASAPAEELLVAAAVSLREPVMAIATSYEMEQPGVGVILTFGASSLLGAQIRSGAPIDVFLSADERIVQDLSAEDWVVAEEAFPFARNRLVVIRSEELPRVEANLDQLFGPSVRRIAIPGTVVPVGRYAREWLQRVGLLQRIAPRLVITEHARATLSAVDSGHADLAIVYATDARLARSAKLAYEIPADEQPNIFYSAARVRASGSAERAAEFLAFLQTPAASAELVSAGFLLARDPPADPAR